MAVATIPDDELARSYRWALAYARREARRDDELAERLIDSATDGVMHARAKYDPGRGASFATYCGIVVRGRVRLAMLRFVGKARGRPKVGHYPEDYDPAARPALMPTDAPTCEAFDALPDELRSAARFYHLDGYSLEDCGLLLGITIEGVRQRLARAAAALAG